MPRRLSGAGASSPSFCLAIPSVAALVEAMPPENAARLRRLLGELLPALWAEGMRRRVDGTVGPLDSFARAAPPDVAARWAARHRG